ncbi:MAG: orotidine-5'-phosphate decarboxylase [Candidatus Marinimicrobia bacterium]|nr:orotidine-5'-phosphate decarboxylase [Candidatus Neomarinimicrobiota bacterium]
MMTSQISFNEKLNAIQEQSESMLCVGLDPDLERLPASLPKNAVGVAHFCENIIQSTKDHVCAYKINSAFFEVLGGDGFDLLSDIRELIPEKILTIYDVKRGDIGNTAKHYARAAFHELDMDAVTINPYMGYDAVEPFIQDPERGVFILGLTSNPGSQDFQQLMLGSDDRLYIQVIKKAAEWNTQNNVGLVVGATKAEAFGEIRRLINDMPILAPGVGAQGGDLKKILQAGLTEQNTGLIIPISRAVIFASDHEDFAEKAGSAAKEFKDQINRTIDHAD